MAHGLLETGLMLLTSNLGLMVLQRVDQAGMQVDLLQLSTAMHMEIQQLVAVVVVADQVDRTTLLVVVVPDNGEMASILQAHPIHVRNANFSA